MRNLGKRIWEMEKGRERILERGQRIQAIADHLRETGDILGRWGIENRVQYRHLGSQGSEIRVSLHLG